MRKAKEAIEIKEKTLLPTVRPEVRCLAVVSIIHLTSLVHSAQQSTVVAAVLDHNSAARDGPFPLLSNLHPDCIDCPWQDRKMVVDISARLRFSLSWPSPVDIKIALHVASAFKVQVASICRIVIGGGYMDVRLAGKPH